ncbi:MAG: hypothetical protein JWP63_6400 [Candidatus Solibacter sp.]|nr:hypothetical protein [Candidatus Solibacter sp.]
MTLTKLRLGVSLLLGIGTAHATTVIIPQSALIPSTTYYTESIGGGIGSIVVMTDGGNEPGVGDPTGRNDDGFRGPIGLGFSLNFFGNTYSQIFANNNGNVSFTDGIPAFTPQGPQGATVPVISPFFGDVDTRNAASGVLHVRSDISNEIILTWDQVGYFGSHADKLDSFQLVLRSSNFAVPAGEGQIGFFYKGMGWETGDASGGSGGFGGSPAAVGFGDGSANGSILFGSTQNGIAAEVANHHIWFALSNSGIPTTAPESPSTVPEPAVTMLLGSGLVLASAVGKKLFGR